MTCAWPFLKQAAFFVTTCPGLLWHWLDRLPSGDVLVVGRTGKPKRPILAVWRVGHRRASDGLRAHQVSAQGFGNDGRNR